MGVARFLPLPDIQGEGVSVATLLLRLLDAREQGLALTQLVTRGQGFGEQLPQCFAAHIDAELAEPLGRLHREDREKSDQGSINRLRREVQYRVKPRGLRWILGQLEWRGR